MHSFFSQVFVIQARQETSCSVCSIFINVSQQLATTTHFCMLLSSTRTINSDLEGMFFSTSDLRRLSRWGPSRSCSFLTCSSLEMSANSSRNPCRSLHKRITSGYIRWSDQTVSQYAVWWYWQWNFAGSKKKSGYVQTNNCTNLKLSGARKLRRWKSSSRLFCKGVPVRRTLYPIL